jgi:hypothetical protein
MRRNSRHPDSYIEEAMNLAERYAAFLRFFNYFRGKLRGTRQGNYPCITCLLADERKPGESGLNNPFRDAGE